MLKDFRFEENDNTVYVEKYIGHSKIVKIPAYIDGKPVTEIGDRCFRDCSIKTVIIPNTVKFIDDYAFVWCSNLKNAYISNSVTSIGKKAFFGCDSLTSITMPNSVISIGDWAFTYCNGLTSVTIPESITSIGDYAFYGCENLTDIYILNKNCHISRNSIPQNATIHSYMVSIAKVYARAHNIKFEKIK